MDLALYLHFLLCQICWRRAAVCHWHWLLLDH